MKYVIYIISALLAITGFVLIFLGIGIPEILKSMDDPNLLSSGLFALFIILVIQIFKPTPRLLMIFSGLVAAVAINLAPSIAPHGIIGLAAVIPPVVYVLIEYGRQVKAEPVRKTKNGLLIAAGVMACVALAYQAVSFVFFNTGIQWLALFVKLSGYTGLAVFCFLKNRRTSVLYRMLFIGLSGDWFGIPPEGMVFQIVHWAVWVMMMFSSMLVLNDAERTRHELKNAVEIKKITETPG